MIRPRFLRDLLILVVLVSAPLSARAQIDQQMDRLFGSMSNMTDPAIVEGQTRGVITGGSMQVRTGTVNMQVAGFTPPSISAGCGGLDAFGGSFSFVNKEEFINFGRKVAANAAGYTFQLALSALCDSCQARMAELQAKVEEVNRYFQNSCETAQLLVNRGAEAVSLSKQSRAALQKMGAGDNVETANQGPGQKSEVAELASRNPELARKLIPGNVLIRALKHANATAWFDGSSEVLFQDIMSLTGTVIVCVPGVDGCVGPADNISSRDQEPVPFPVKAVLTFDDLVYGNPAGVKMLRCSGECMNPKTETVAGFQGMSERVIELMSGPPGASGAEAGLIGKLAYNIGALTPAEQGFMTGAGYYTALAIGLGRSREHAAHQFVKIFAPEIAAEIISDYVDRVVRWSELAVDINGQDATGMMAEKLRDTRTDIRQQREWISRRIAGHAQILAYYVNMISQLPPPELPQRAYTITGSE